MTERPGPNGDWPLGLTHISIVPAGIQPLNKIEKGGWWQLPLSGAGWEGLEMSSQAASLLPPKVFTSVGAWRMEGTPHSRAGGSGIKLERQMLLPM